MGIGRLAARGAVRIEHVLWHSVLPSHPRWHAFRREHSPSCKRHLDLSQDCALGEAHPIGETLNLETLILVEACDALLLAHGS